MQRLANASWSAVFWRPRARPRQPEQIADIITAQQQRRGAPRRAVDAARQLAHPDTVAVVTGQQAGLFGGPLFTLHKALTALKLADQIAHTHRVPVVPVFWIDAEDHDWDEV